jgi:serine/threonine-protein kinase
VIDRATAKHLQRRYRAATELIADLEDVLALETARAGGATGEATSVIRTLPPRARRRLPFRLRHPGWLALLALVAAGGIAALIIALGHQAHRGTGARGAAKPRGLVPVSLAQDAATDYDPYGTGARGEHPLQRNFVLDRDTSTFWSTETYRGGLGSKPGVGIYLDAKPGVAARALEVRTPDPGWTAAVYAADQSPPHDISGWSLVSPARTVTETTQRFDLTASSQPHRYYLLWISKLPAGQAKLSEIYLFK